MKKQKASLKKNNIQSLPENHIAKRRNKPAKDIFIPIIINQNTLPQAFN
ncbi:MAG: hypothetical protein JW963_18885 [Anaerolineales bacterium]|nr:hypothetical protein [Anaerolineales bacterium]